MKQAIGSYWLTGIFITFVILFTSYMCLSINMNKAFKVKNEIINIVQKNNGLNSTALASIQDYMTKVGYRTTGNCSNNEVGFGVSGTGPSSNRSVFCIAPVTIPSDEQFPASEYYQIRVFFSVDLPVVRQLFTFGLKGSTKRLFYPDSII
ncbi:MAG: hypothetical protein IJ572_00140 [Bacilli bacterium]|nr:hypothetical protein [Bacilli bacterium]